MAVVGHGSHELHFYHSEIGHLRVRSGADRIAWGYSLNTQTYPTYAGEVIQILSCYIDDLEISGSVQTYSDMEQIYTYFLRYTQIATQGDPRRRKPIAGRTSYNQEPMHFDYPHRGWKFEIMPTDIPGYRKARDQIHPEWQIRCHVADESGDADEVKDLILREAEIKAAVGGGADFKENFGLMGRIRFLDENPFSDPFTEFGTDFEDERGKAINKLADTYAKFLPAYMEHDFDEVFGNLGSQPAFNVNKEVAGKAALDTKSKKADRGPLQETYDRIIEAETRRKP